MALRRSKRQQREQELLVSTATDPDTPVSTEHDTTAPTHSAFAALFTPDDEPETPAEESEEIAATPSKSRKTKKKKKKAAQTQGVVTDNSPPTKSTKKGKGKKKDDADDLDKALEELSIRYPDLKHTKADNARDTRTQTLANLLSVSLPHLDAGSELRKFFGSKAVTAAESSESSPSSSRRRHRRIQPAVLRSQLTRPSQTWSFTKQREGLSLRALTEVEAHSRSGRGPAGSGKWFTVEYSKRYKGVTRAFIRAVMSGTPEALWDVLRELPWHADALLQLAAVYRHREEFSTAVEHMERAIFAYESAFLGAFSFNTGINRLDFNFVENRPFFLAIHQQVIDLQRRGCPRAAFEHARLLFSLQPLSDPHGALLHLDFLSVKAGMGDWLEEVWKVYHDIEEGEDYTDPSILPGWAYARALILRGKEKTKRDRGEDTDDESTEALRQAIIAFPSIVPLLADKCEISLPSEVRSHKEFRIHTDSIGLSPEESILHVLSHIYAIRSMNLWKSSSLSSWLVSTATSVLSTFSSKCVRPMRDRFLRVFTSDHLRESIYRHIIVLEQTHAQQQNRVLTAFIPREVLNAHQYACDPLPPRTARTLYDSVFFGTADLRTHTEEHQIEHMLPDELREQFFAMFDRIPLIREQMPGDMLQFVQDMLQRPDGVIQNLRAGAGWDEFEQALHDFGEMPGGMPEDGDEVEDVPVADLLEADRESATDEEREPSEGEDDEEAESLPSMPMRVVHNLFNRFWGTARGTDEDSSDDDNIVVRDQGGVD